MDKKLPEEILFKLIPVIIPLTSMINEVGMPDKKDLQNLLITFNISEINALNELVIWSDLFSHFSENKNTRSILLERGIPETWVNIALKILSEENIQTVPITSNNQEKIEFNPNGHLNNPNINDCETLFMKQISNKEVLCITSFGIVIKNINTEDYKNIVTFPTKLYKISPTNKEIILSNTTELLLFDISNNKEKYKYHSNYEIHTFFVDDKFSQLAIVEKDTIKKMDLKTNQMEMRKIHFPNSSKELFFSSDLSKYVVFIKDDEKIKSSPTSEITSWMLVDFSNNCIQSAFHENRIEKIIFDKTLTYYIYSFEKNVFFRDTKFNNIIWTRDCSDICDELEIIGGCFSENDFIVYLITAERDEPDSKLNGMIKIICLDLVNGEFAGGETIDYEYFDSANILFSPNYEFLRIRASRLNSSDISKNNTLSYPIITRDYLRDKDHSWIYVKCWQEILGFGENDDGIFITKDYEYNEKPNSRIFPNNLDFLLFSNIQRTHDFSTNMIDKEGLDTYWEITHPTNDNNFSTDDDY